MKLFKHILFLCTVALLAACSTDVDTPELNPSSQFVSPVIGKCGNVIVNQDNSNSETVIFTWTPADFGQKVQTLYSVYVTDGNTSGLVGTSNTTSLAVKKGDLNGVVINTLGYKANTTAAIQAYVVAQVQEATQYSVTSELSNSFTVNTYAAALKHYYICGAFTGSWAIAEAPIIYETAGGSNTYTTMCDFTVEGDTRSYFKITEEQNWSAGNWGYNYLTPSWTCPEQADSNLSVDISESCIHQLTFNTVAMTIDDKPIGNVISLTGSFCSWGDGADFTYDYQSASWKTQPLDFVANEEIKVFVNHKWDINWGDGGDSDAIAGGTALSSGAGNIVVANAGTYVVVLHANRTPMVLELVKQ